MHNTKTDGVILKFNEITLLLTFINDKKIWFPIFVKFTDATKQKARACILAIKNKQENIVKLELSTMRPDANIFENRNGYCNAAVSLL